MKLATRVNEILATPKRRVSKILIDRKDGKFLPDGDKNIVLNSKSGSEHTMISLSPEDLDTFIAGLRKTGKTTLQGVMN